MSLKFELPDDFHSRPLPARLRIIATAFPPDRPSNRMLRALLIEAADENELMEGVRAPIEIPTLQRPAQLS